MTKAITRFSPEVIKDLQYYVYRLVDPRYGETFYIGKGKGNRVFQHIEDAGKTKDEDDSLKIKTIKQIQKSGKKVIQIIHRWGLCETAAFELEAALIDAYESLTNIVSGKRSDVSPLTVEQIQNTLGIKETAKFEHKVLIIKITQDSIKKQNNNIYEAVRKAWKINLKNAKQAEYVLAACSGFIIGVYEWEKWEVFKEGIYTRYGFKGKEAPEKIQVLYKNKLIPREYMEKGAVFPIRYSWKTTSKRGKNENEIF